MIINFRKLFIALTLLTPFIFCGITSSAEAEEDDFMVMSATCDDVYALYADASAEGDEVDTEAKEHAQDDILYLVVWVHGYLSGRDGIDPDKRPLDDSGIEQTVADIDAACKSDRSKRFLDAVTTIQ